MAARVSCLDFRRLPSRPAEALLTNISHSFAPESVVRSRGRPPYQSRHITVASSLSSPSVASRRPDECWTASRGCIAPPLSPPRCRELAALRSSMPSVRNISRSPGSAARRYRYGASAESPERRVGLQRDGLDAAVAQSQRWRMAGVDDRAVSARRSIRASCPVTKPRSRRYSTSAGLAAAAWSASPTPARRALRSPPTSTVARSGVDSWPMASVIERCRVSRSRRSRTCRRRCCRRVQPRRRG